MLLGEKQAFERMFEAVQDVDVRAATNATLNLLAVLIVAASGSSEEAEKAAQCVAEKLPEYVNQQLQHQGKSSIQ